MSCSSPCSAASSPSPLSPLNISIPSLSGCSSTEQKTDKYTTEYLEKRKKNNDAARRSREIRRLREQAAKQRMEELEEENRELHQQLAVLRLEYSQLMILLLTKSISPTSSECSSS